MTGSAAAEFGPEDVVVAVDVGGTMIKAGLMTVDGRVHAERRVPTGVGAGSDAVIDRILTLTAELAVAPGVRAVGLGVPGTVDVEAGIAGWAVNLGWRDVAFGGLIGERTGLPVALGQDARSAAAAEARWGAGRTERSMYFLAIGTGIAGGAVRDGVVDMGATGRSGEIGHLVVVPDGPLCNCGNHGCLETVASASQIAARYSRSVGGEFSAADVARLAADGDPVAVEVWTAASAALADGLAALTLLIDPGLFVLGGGLSLAGASLLEPVRDALALRLTFREAPAIALTALGDRAGLLGAGLLAWDRVGRSA